MPTTIDEGLQPSSNLQPSTTLQPKSRQFITEDDTINLLDGQYEINGVVFGTRNPRLNPNPYLVKSFEVEPGTLTNGTGGNLSQASGTTGVLTADSSLPMEDGTRFGVDFSTGMVLTWSIDAWRPGNFVYDDVAALKSAWRDPKLRTQSNVNTVLRICRGGRTRLVYGRPRKFKETYGNMEQGYAPIDCQFQCSDESFYDDNVQVKTIGLINPSVNGAVYPTVYPKRFQSNQEAFTTVVVQGNFPTFPQYKITGPVLNPKISVANGWTLKLNAYIDNYDYLIIDPRPWRRYMEFIIADGRRMNAMGFVTADSPTMREMYLEPGQHSIVFDGIDPTNTATLEIGWRNAWATP